MGISLRSKPFHQETLFLGGLFCFSSIYESKLSTPPQSKKASPVSSGEALYRGPERIRTAVEAFAELCLATRPQDLFLGRENNANKLIIKEFYHYSDLSDICILKLNYAGNWRIRNDH